MACEKRLPFGSISGQIPSELMTMSWAKNNYLLCVGIFISLILKIVRKNKTVLQHGLLFTT